ncbi:hypothetical protein GALMADRAFT_146065 [Galerina marginata CBS 339.88]|uniref:Uncharacterized protein n=1 Tax=Galerina marginata (strain CBS 339.88) TaxID=685588 RepID=A0A067SFC3_GALM3|nr:hypothetical protein GALMADRAFT_146065 [Galerina marginata CBS 339.88]
MERLRASGHAFNTRGFPALPDEIYLEILSHLPTIPVPTEDTIDICNPKSHPNRQLILSSLSQTCQSLRRVFLRYLWQRIEVYEAMDTQKGPLPTFDVLRKRPISNYVHSRYAEEVVRQLEIVTIRDPNLAQHVNVLNIVLSYSVETLLPELARCISLFPNLHTVQMHFFGPFVTPVPGVATTFEGYKYPQIRNVCLSDNCAGFLASCPRANRVTPYMHVPCCSHLLPCAKERCPQIEFFEYLIFSPTTYDFAMNHFKNLCDVTLYWDLLISYVDQLRTTLRNRLNLASVLLDFGLLLGQIFFRLKCLNSA